MEQRNQINLIGISGKIGSGKDTAAKLINYHCTGGDEEYTDIEGFLEFYDDGLDMYPWEVKKFADKLKQIISLLTGISVEDLNKQEIKNSYLGPEWDKKIPINGGAGGWNLADVNKYEIKRMKVRDMLQILGTEALRQKVHNDVHTNALFADYKTSLSDVEGDWKLKHKYPKWLIPDTRFLNEALSIANKGGINLRIDIPILDKSVSQFVRGNTVYELSNHISETELDDYPFDYRIVNDGTLEEFSNKIKEFLTAFKII